MPMPKASNIYPRRSDIFIADLNPSFGQEMHKKRPVLVISNNTLNKTLPTVVIIPFSSIIPDFVGADVVRISKAQGGLDEDSVLITNQIRSIDKGRLVKRTGKILTSLLPEVEQALKITLSFNNG